MRLLRKDGVESMTDTLMDQTSEAKRTALGTLLIERGYIDQEQLDEALRRSAENGERLGEVIVKLGWASEDDLAKVLAEQWHLRYFERSAISFDGKALRRMSWEDASRLEALPIQENDEGGVVVAVAEPTDARLLALRELLGDRIDFVVVAKRRDRDGSSQRAARPQRKSASSRAGRGDRSRGQRRSRARYDRRRKRRDRRGRQRPVRGLRGDGDHVAVRAPGGVEPQFTSSDPRRPPSSAAMATSRVRTTSTRSLAR